MYNNKNTKKQNYANIFIYFIYILIVITSMNSINAADYSVKINEILINRQSLKDHNTVIIAETDTIVFRYSLDQTDTTKTIAPFLFKLVLNQNGEISERTTAGLKEIAYYNLTHDKYTFEISAFDLAGNWKTNSKVIKFEVNNKTAALLKKIDTLEISKDSINSTIAALKESIEESNNRNKLEKIIIYCLGVVALIFLILFLVFLIKEKKKNNIINSLNTKLEDNETKMLSVETTLNNSCPITNVDKLKNEIENINKKLENITELSDSFNKDVNAVHNKIIDLSNLRINKNKIFENILIGINNPTDTIKSLVELLRNYDLNATDINDVLTNIIDYTNKIIDNVEDIQRFIEFENENSKVTLNFDTVDVVYIINTAIQKNITDANKKNITIKINIAPDVNKIRGDQHKLIVAIHNLINNAVKYTNENGKININVYQKENNVYFEIIDNGIGIKQDDLKKLYDNLSEDHDQDVIIGINSTIGLLTVKKYVEAHHGKIIISSEINKGSTFSFNIPTKKY